MANTSTIDLTSLDFDTLKSSLVSYLKQQDRFKDYDFDGSNMNVLLDILSYNTYLNSFYLNMVASESFLDTAQLDTSVYSHSKELNYLPRSAKSAKAILNLNFNTTNTSTIIIPKGTGFAAKVGITSYNFYTDSTNVYHSSNNYWNIEGVEVYEGSYITDTFVMDYRNPTQRFIISNAGVDTDTIEVYSIEDNGSNSITYFKKETLLDLDSNSKAFFMQGAETGKFEVIFGDDIIGRRPKDGSIISVKYRVSSGEGSNGAKAFALNKDIVGNDSKFAQSLKITASQAATGGSDKEDVASVKYNAPRHFQTQERAVSTGDYETLLKIQFPEINNIAVYGGETINPPRYGKVFISVDISNIDGFPDSKKALYYDFLKPRMPLTHEPIFVSPSKIYYSVNSLIRYNVNLTTLNPSEIETLVKNKIVKFDKDYLNKFNSILRYSKLTKEMDSADNSIVGNETELFVYKKIYPKFDTAQNIIVNFNIPLLDTLFPIGETHPATDLHTIYSTEFFYKGQSSYLEDDANGNIRIVTTNGKVHKTTTNIGTINYAKGIVRLNNFNINYYTGPELKIYALAAEKDIYTGQNDILNLEKNEINLTVQAIRE